MVALCILQYHKFLEGALSPKLYCSKDIIIALNVSDEDKGSSIKTPKITNMC